MSSRGAVRKRPSTAARKAASVLPDPVGAAMSVWRPSRIRGQPSRCGAVGSPRRAPNQEATAGWNTAKESLADTGAPSER